MAWEVFVPPEMRKRVRLVFKRRNGKLENLGTLPKYKINAFMKDIDQLRRERK